MPVSNTVAVDDLQVGMFVHLDLGWMRHPFPLSSFRIASPEQIETIRQLGVGRVRWAPEKSELGEQPGASAEGAPDPGIDAADAAPTAESDAQRETRRRRELLATQREATRRCEQQYVEAGQALRESYLRALHEPEKALEDTQVLVGALTDKMLIDGELCIRLLSISAGDRACAHGMNVAVVSLLMGRAMALPAPEMTALGVGALLHDVGKLELPERLRHAEDRAAGEDLEAYREHVARGVALGRRMGMDDGALMVLAQHHEMADGSGFPLRLSAERMTIAARIVALVNRYDNLCNPTQLTRALTPHEALSMLFAQSRSKFDVPILNTFIRMMGVYPAGSIVQLTDERHAMVVGVNSTRPLKPRVLVYDPQVPPEEALVLDLERAGDIGIRRSLPPAKLSREAFEYLAPRPRVTYYFEPAGAGAGDRGPAP